MNTRTPPPPAPQRARQAARTRLAAGVAAGATAWLLAGPPAWQAAAAATPAELLAAYSTAAGSAAVAARGEQFFASRHGAQWSCSSCHGATPVQPGRHASTGKAISALAPAANAQRFTDAAKAEKWFRRNCNDVLGRECSAGEKADVLAWLMALPR